MAADTTNEASERLSFLQVFLPLVVAFSKCEAGLCIGWSAVLPKMQADNSTTLTITDHDVKWLVSIVGIAGIVCTIAVGPLIEWLGPRRLLLWTHLPSAVLWLISAFTPYKILLYFGRVGLILTFTVLGPLIPMLISELSDPKIRGFTLAMEEIAVAMSVLLMYIFAQWLDWVIATAICAIPSLFLFLLGLLLPESPYWLARKGRLEEAETSLFKLRSSKSSATNEMDNLTSSANEEPQTTFLDQLKKMRSSQNIRPVVLVLSIFVLRELGGEFVVFNYTVYIFQEAGVEMDAFTCTVLVGVIRLIFTIISSFLLDRLGRRPLIIATTVVCLLSSGVCGLFLLIDVSWAPSWIPLASVLVYVASYGLGLGPIPWGLVGEMIPTPVRSLGGPICIIGYSTAVFVVSYIFPILKTSIGLGYVLLVFAAFLFILAIILSIWFPETRGKTLSELQDSFKSNKEKKTAQVPVSNYSNDTM